MDEVKVYAVKFWMVECPECQEEFMAPDDLCASGASFEAECPKCDSKFNARCE